MDLTLAQIKEVLEEGFKPLKKIEGQNVVLVIGNTGSGKSTMLSSLLKGPKSLEKKTVKFMMEVLQKDGSKIEKEKTKNVIDNKEAEDGSVFKIGHSDTNSETFLPSFIHDPTDGWK